MNRRQYLVKAGVGVSALPDILRITEVTDHITITITETNDPVRGGDLLELSGKLENGGTSTERVEVDFIVGEDEEVVSQRTIPIEPGDTHTIDFLQYRTYPVREDVTIPVRLETETAVAETTIDVIRVDEFDSQYAYPDREQELTVKPGTTILFEVADELVDQQGNTHWYVDGEYITTPGGPWPGTYFYEVGREYFTHTFESEGTYSLDAVVTTVDLTAASRWEVTVTEDSPEPPAVDASRPTTRELGADESTTLELDISSPDTELDRVVWWLTQADEILDVSDVSGTSDTASIDIDGGCHTCQIHVWVIDENNVYTVAHPWEFEEYEEEATTDSSASVETLDDFESKLAVEGIEVDYLELLGEYVYLDYYTQASTDQEALEEIWTIASAYADLIDSGHEAAAFQAIFMDQNGTDLGSFIIGSEWAEDYADGELSREEYLDRILETLETE